MVWKFSRFTRKREHAVAFKSMLRRRGIRVTSITEHADDTPTGKLMEAIIESVDEFRCVQRLLKSRAPKQVNPRRLSSPYLLSGLVAVRSEHDGGRGLGRSIHVLRLPIED